MIKEPGVPSGEKPSDIPQEINSQDVGSRLEPSDDDVQALARPEAAPDEAKTAHDKQQLATMKEALKEVLGGEITAERVPQQIASMVEADQFMRENWKTAGYDPEVDRQNTEILREVIKKHGWPKISSVGKEVSEGAWLIAQHADHDVVFQEECLKLMQSHENDVDRKLIAYLEDRVLKNNDKPQKYGTQWTIEEDERLIPYPIDDIDTIDQRRASMGLEPYAEYVKKAEAKQTDGTTPDSETSLAQDKELDPPVEIKHSTVYESQEWKNLSPVERGQLLLVAEGVKDGCLVDLDYGTSGKILEDLGLVSELLTEKGDLKPSYFVASQEKMTEVQRRILTIPKDLSEDDFLKQYWEIRGEASSFPSCCVEEFVEPKRNLGARKLASEGKSELIANFDFEVEKAAQEGRPVPKELLYAPPDFKPCHIDCENAQSVIQKWKKVIEKADHEAAEAIREHNLTTFDYYKHAFPEESQATEKKQDDKKRLKDLRESLNN